jgi:hypothetical protein
MHICSSYFTARKDLGLQRKAESRLLMTMSRGGYGQRCSLITTAWYILILLKQKMNYHGR